MRDTTGISLSTADPDNMNDPEFSVGLADEVEDYCAAEFQYGDVTAAMLEAGSRGTVNGTALPKGFTGAGRRRGRRKGFNKVLLLAGAGLLAFALFALLNSKQGG
jgi:hypothetical protein